MVLNGRGRRIVVAVVATLALGVGTGGWLRALEDPPVVFGSDAGIVLTFVHPAKQQDFDLVLERFRQVLESSEDIIRRQQAENWRVFSSPDPGPNGSVMYIGFMEPVLKGANYRIADILAEELPEEEAAELLATLEDSMAQPQRPLSLEMVLDLENLPPADESAADSP